MGIRELSKLDKEKLIDIIRKQRYELCNLRKDVKSANARWRDYYRKIDFEVRTKGVDNGNNI